LSDFTDEERKILIKFLKKIIKNADQ
jgi:hypothetical protein